MRCGLGPDAYCSGSVSEAAFPITHARAHMQLAALLGQFHLALAFGELGLLFRAALPVAVRTAHALDVVR